MTAHGRVAFKVNQTGGNQEMSHQVENRNSDKMRQVENSHDAGHYVAIRISPSDTANLKLIAEVVSIETKALHAAASKPIPIVISFI